MITLLSIYTLIDCGINKFGLREYIFLFISVLLDLIILPLNLLVLLASFIGGDFK